MIHEFAHNWFGILMVSHGTACPLEHAITEIITAFTACKFVPASL